MNRRFTAEEILLLKEHPCVSSIEEDSITFTPEFMQELYQNYKAGIPVRQTVTDTGIDPNILGYIRLNSLAYRMKTKLSKENNTYSAPKATPFTEEQIAELKSNPNVYNVTTKNLYFTIDFKTRAFVDLRAGKDIKDILLENGINPDTIGAARVRSIGPRLEFEYLKHKSFSQGKGARNETTMSSLTFEERKDRRRKEEVKRSVTYQKEHYDRYVIRMPKGLLPELRQAAKDRGIFINELFVKGACTYAGVPVPEKKK